MVADMSDARVEAAILAHDAVLNELAMAKLEHGVEFSIADVKQLAFAAALKAALAVEQDPVGWICAEELDQFKNSPDGCEVYLTHVKHNDDAPLYAAPVAAPVQVKALEWKLVHDCWLAECIGHAYEVHNDEIAEYKKRQCQFDFEARIRSALVAAPSRDDVVQWQDISTAPDSGHFLLFGATCHDLIIRFTGYRAMNGLWYTDAGQICHPSHWRPLPSGPVDNQNSGNKPA